MKWISLKRGQSIVEYVVILSVILASLIFTGFIGRVRGAFQTYFDAAVNTIVPPG